MGVRLPSGRGGLHHVHGARLMAALASLVMVLTPKVGIVEAIDDVKAEYALSDAECDLLINEVALMI